MIDSLDSLCYEKLRSSDLNTKLGNSQETSGKKKIKIDTAMAEMSSVLIHGVGQAPIKLDSTPVFFLTELNANMEFKSRTSPRNSSCSTRSVLQIIPEALCQRRLPAILYGSQSSVLIAVNSRVLCCCDWPLWKATQSASYLATWMALWWPHFV